MVPAEVRRDVESLVCAQNPHRSVDLVASVMPEQVVNPVPDTGPALVRAPRDGEEAVDLRDAQLAGRDPTPHLANGGKRAHRVADEELARGRTGQGSEALRVSEAQRDRYLDDGVLAGLQRRRGLRGVQAARRSDEHDVHLGVLERVREIRGAMAEGPLSGEAAGRLRGPCDDPTLPTDAERVHRLHVCRCDTAGSNQAETEGRAHGTVMCTSRGDVVPSAPRRNRNLVPARRRLARSAAERLRPRPLLAQSLGRARSDSPCSFDRPPSTRFADTDLPQTRRRCSSRVRRRQEPSRPGHASR